jgi:succinyl-CoA synthetase alpha subunit
LKLLRGVIFKMSILINNKSNVLVQGITGKEGSRATKEMLDYGTNVLCGVTPGKGGQSVESKPVFNSVFEAKKSFPNLDASVIYVPPLAAKDSVFEAISNGIKLVVLITENIPIHDCAKMYAFAKQHGSWLIGPSSIGVISSGESKLGSIGGDSNIQYEKGPVGIISKSGGMCSETAMMLKKEGYGTSTVVGIGGDVIPGSDYEDILKLFENDVQTKVIVLLCEIGGLLEQKAADYINKHMKKPVIAYVSGEFAQNLPKVSLGHAGAILEGRDTSREAKVKYFIENYINVAKQHHNIIDLVKKILK